MSKELDVFGSFSFNEDDGEFMEELCIGTIELEENSDGSVRMPDFLEFNGVNYIAQF